MKVSVIVPVYNAEKYITECFNSITNQTYKNIEAVFVDDCSTDKSCEVLEKLIKRNEKNGKIQYKIVKHETNQKDCTARNTGIKESSGDYIFFMDNDDVIIPDCIEILLNLSKKYPKAEIISGGFCSLSEDKWYKLFYKNMTNRDWNIIYEVIIYKNKAENIETVIDDSIEFYLSNQELHKNIYMPAPWARLYKKDFIEKNNIYFPDDLPNVGDLYFSYLCYKNASQVIIDYTPIYFWRLRASSASHEISVQYNRIEYMTILLERILADYNDKKHLYLFAKWMSYWTNVFLKITIRMKGEKEQIFIQKYIEILEKIKLLISGK